MTSSGPQVAAVPGVSTEDPYPGLQAFGEADRAFYFGRDSESRDLFTLVQRETLTVLFGRSGLGKTSLLNAGLYPLLRQAGILPIPVRLDFTADRGLVAQVGAACGKAASEHDVEVPPLAADQTLWEYFHRTPFFDRRNRLLTPLLVFDPFEEIFTHGRQYAGGVDSFLVELADLIENQVPQAVRERVERTDQDLDFPFDRQKVRVLLCLREDFLADLVELQARMPSLMQNRYRLLPMNGDQALDAILKPRIGLVDRQAASEILKVVAGRRQDVQLDTANDRQTLEIEPAILSLFCRELNSRRKLQRLETISSNLVLSSSHEILAAFYERCLVDSGRPVRSLIESRMVTPAGNPASVFLAEAVGSQGVTREALDRLVDRRLLRFEERFHQTQVELIHEVMTPIVLESRVRRRDQLRRRGLIWAVAGLAVVSAALIIGLYRTQSDYLKKTAEDYRVISYMKDIQVLRGDFEAANPGWPEHVRQEGESLATRIDSVNSIRLTPPRRIIQREYKGWALLLVARTFLVQDRPNPENDRSRLRYATLALQELDSALGIMAEISKLAARDNNEGDRETERWFNSESADLNRTRYLKATALAVIARAGGPHTTADVRAELARIPQEYLKQYPPSNNTDLTWALQH